MHQKIVVTDRELLFLGSSNLTPTSLEIHGNLVVGLFSPELALFAEQKLDTEKTCSIEGRLFTLFLLPDKEKKALHKIYELIDTAEKKIELALFSLTHPTIGDHLLCAQNRGVAVTLIIDSYAAAGAGKKQVERLLEAGVEVRTSLGRELLHHKWARFDEQKFLLGSTNWTKAAFEKNSDCFLLFHELLPKEKKYLDDLWKILRTESQPATSTL